MGTKNNIHDPDIFKGHFVTAMPDLADPNFEYTVTSICEHTGSGALGIIINRVLPGISAKDIFKELNLEHKEQSAEIPIYFGGPVHMNEIFILHGPPFTWAGCLKVSSFLALSNTMDILKAIASGKGPSSFLIALGCAGWGPEQLETEIRQNSWITCPAVEEIIFSCRVEEKWKAALKAAGVDPAMLSSKAGNA